MSDSLQDSHDRFVAYAAQFDWLECMDLDKNPIVYVGWLHYTPGDRTLTEGAVIRQMDGTTWHTSDWNGGGCWRMRNEGWMRILELEVCIFEDALYRYNKRREVIVETINHTKRYGYRYAEQERQLKALQAFYELEEDTMPVHFVMWLAAWLKSPLKEV